ncbi:MAG: AI-2E family transporter [bacterium]
MPKQAANRDKVFTNFLKILGVLLLLGFLYLIQEALITVIFAIALAYFLRPLVLFIDKIKIGKYQPSRDFSVGLAFIIAFVVIGLFGYYLFPPIIAEFNQLMQNFPNYFIKFQQIFTNFQRQYLHQLPAAWQDTVDQGIQYTYTYLSKFMEQGIQKLIGVISNILSWVLIPVITYYMLKEDQQLKDGLLYLFPREHRSMLSKLLDGVSSILTQFVKGQITLCFIIGVTIAVSYSILGVKYALLLALIAGITEAIPFIGPFLGYLPVLIVTLVASPAIFIEATFIYFFLQLVENWVLVPRIMGYYVRLPSAMVLISMLVMTQVMGASGLFFAVPIVASANVAFEILRKNHWQLTESKKGR